MDKSIPKQNSSIRTTLKLTICVAVGGALNLLGYYQAYGEQGWRFGWPFDYAYKSSWNALGDETLPLVFLDDVGFRNVLVTGTANAVTWVSILIGIWLSDRRGGEIFRFRMTTLLATVSAACVWLAIIPHTRFHLDPASGLYYTLVAIAFILCVEAIKGYFSLLTATRDTS